MAAVPVFVVVHHGAKAAQPLRTLGEPLADLMGPMPYTAIQSLLDPLWTAGAQNYFTGALLSGFVLGWSFNYFFHFAQMTGPPN